MAAQVTTDPTDETAFDTSLLRGMLARLAGTGGAVTVAIDQTTPGTTNAVAPIAGQNGVAGGAGVAGATVQRVTVATDDALHTKLGEVQASPTSNTVLDRLKALLTGIVLAAGSNLIGRAVADASATTGGIASTARLLSAAGTTQDATNVKASAGRVYGIQGYNAATSVRYLKLYNKATAPTVGADTPVKTLALPASSAFAFDFPLGYSFATGIGFGLTTDGADASTASVTAADILALNIDYV